MNHRGERAQKNPPPTTAPSHHRVAFNWTPANVHTPETRKNVCILETIRKRRVMRTQKRDGLHSTHLTIAIFKWAEPTVHCLLTVSARACERACVFGVCVCMCASNWLADMRVSSILPISCICAVKTASCDLTLSAGARLQLPRQLVSRVSGCGFHVRTVAGCFLRTRSGHVASPSLCDAQYTPTVIYYYS